MKLQAFPNVKSKKVSHAVSKLFATLIGSNTETFRGFNLGQAISEIKAKEKFKLFENENEYLGFTYDSPSFETIDILYFKDEFKRIEKIQVDVFMNSDSSNEELFTLAENYFNEKHIFNTQKASVLTWITTNNVIISLTKVKNDIERGLLIVISNNQ